MWATRVVALSSIMEEFDRIRRKAFAHWNHQLVENAVAYQLIKGEPMRDYPPSQKGDTIPYSFDPIRNGLLRSIKGHNEWYMVIDTDAPELNNAMLEAAYLVYRSCSDKERPVLKLSGQKGVQLYWRHDLKHPKTPEIMRDWVYTKYMELEIGPSYDILFGRDPDHPTKPYWDITMFQEHRMWRVYCTRLRGYEPNGRYSVPLTVGDTLDVAQRKMELDLTLEYATDVERHLLHDIDKKVAHHFDIDAYRESNLPPTTTPPKDAIEERLTPMLRAIMARPGMVPREWRYALVSYLWCYMGIRSEEDIFNFIMERTKWEPKTASTMRYQIRSVVKTCQNRWPEKPVPSFVWREPDGGTNASE